MANYPGELLWMHGTADAVAPYETAEAAMQQHNGSYYPRGHLSQIWDTAYVGTLAMKNGLEPSWILFATKKNPNTNSQYICAPLGM
jgi:hypothetical protein